MHKRDAAKVACIRAGRGYAAYGKDSHPAKRDRTVGFASVYAPTTSVGDNVVYSDIKKLNTRQFGLALAAPSTTNIWYTIHLP